MVFLSLSSEDMMSEISKNCKGLCSLFLFYFVVRCSSLLMLVLFPIVLDYSDYCFTCVLFPCVFKPCFISLPDCFFAPVQKLSSVCYLLWKAVLYLDSDSACSLPGLFPWLSDCLLWKISLWLRFWYCLLPVCYLPNCCLLLGATLPPPGLMCLLYGLGLGPDTPALSKTFWNVDSSDVDVGF